MSEEKIPYSFTIHKSRTLANLLKDTFQFLVSEMSLFMQALAMYSFSLLLLALLTSYLFVGNIVRFESIIYLKDSVSKPGLVIVLFSSLVLAASFCTLTLVVNRVLLLRQEQQEETHRKLFSDLRTDFMEQLKAYALNFIIIFLLYEVAFVGLNYVERSSFFMDYTDINGGPFHSTLNWLIVHSASLIVMPLLMYFAFSSLFVSIRDSMGSSDAVKKIYLLSKDKLIRVWLYSLVFLLIGYFIDWVLGYFLEFYMRILLYNYNLLFVLVAFKKMAALLILVLLQIASVLLFGSQEKDTNVPKENLDEPSGNDALN